MTEKSATVRRRVKNPDDDEVFVFPDLVYIELLALLAAMVVLIVWSMVVDAPLGSIADPNRTENPAKAPWYFVGLQELLVYFDPWIAGVVIPGAMVVGLMLLPYVDTNRAGTGRYTFRGREIAIVHFVFGFSLWFILIFIGQFLRGPNWQFYWPWESWEQAKMAEAALVELPLWAGISGTLLFFGGGLALPALLKKGIWKDMGPVRYVLAWTMALLMYGVVFKMALRLFLGIKYVLVTPWFKV